MPEMLHKGFSVEHRKVAPNQTDMDAIREHSGSKEISEDDVFCGSMLLCNDQIDRAFERFPKSYLDRFAETLPGKSLMPGHDYKMTPLGRFYDASVVKRDGTYHLLAKYFVDAKDERTVRAIQLGVWKDVSIGYNAGGRKCSECGKDPYSQKNGTYVCEHNPGDYYDGKQCHLEYTNPERAEAMEGSVVWNGCQYGARLHGAAAPLSAQKAAAMQSAPAKENLMDNDETKGAPAGAEETKALRLETETLKKQLAEREPLAADGRLYRDHLKAEIGRKYGAVGAAQTGAAICKALENASAEELRAADAEVQTMFDVKFPPSPQSRQLGAGAEESPEQQQQQQPDRKEKRPFDPLATMRSLGGRF